MNAKVTDSGPCKKQLEIEIEPEKVKSSYDEALSELCREATLKGFRKGRAPRDRVEKQFGKALRDDVKQKVVSEALSAAIKEKDLKVLNLIEPKDLAEREMKPGEAFTFSVDIEVAPEVKLPDYKQLAVEVPTSPVADGMVDHSVEELRREAADVKPVSGTTVQSRDQAIVDYSLAVDGAVVSERKETAIEVHDRDVLGLPVRLAPEKLIGAASEEERAFDDVEIDESSPLREHHGKKASLKVKVHEIRRPELPPLDDEFAKRLGMASVAELRERVKASLTSRMEAELRKAKEEAVLAKLLELTQFELPQGILERMSSAYTQQSTGMLARLGYDQSSIVDRSAHLAEIARTRSENELRRSFILQAVADAEAIELTDEEMEKGLAELARPRGLDPLKLRENLERAGRLGEVRGELTERKVLDFLLGRADIKETGGSAAGAAAGEPKAQPGGDETAPLAGGAA